MSQQCFNCGSVIEESDNQCPGCGAVVIRSSEPASPAPVVEEPQTPPQAYAQTPYQEAPQPQAYAQTPYQEAPQPQAYAQTPNQETPQSMQQPGNWQAQANYQPSPPPSAAPKSKKGLIIGISIAVVVALAVAGVLLWYFVFRTPAGSEASNNQAASSSGKSNKPKTDGSNKPKPAGPVNEDIKDFDFKNMRIEGFLAADSFDLVDGHATISTMSGADLDTEINLGDITYIDFNEDNYLDAIVNYDDVLSLWDLELSVENYRYFRWDPEEKTVVQLEGEVSAVLDTGCEDFDISVEDGVVKMHQKYTCDDYNGQEADVTYAALKDADYVVRTDGPGGTALSTEWAQYDNETELTPGAKGFDLRLYPDSDAPAVKDSKKVKRVVKSKMPDKDNPDSEEMVPFVRNGYTLVAFTLEDGAVPYGKTYTAWLETDE